MKGFKEADTNFATADDQKKFLEQTSGKGYKFLKSIPNFNNNENRYVGPPDVVEKCAPVFVNCKGTLGSVSMKAKPKNIGRLDGPPIKQIDCGTSINDIRDFVRGDPGSLFTFLCPEGCAAGGGLVGSAL